MEGYTTTERFLNDLGKNSFLRFWSWPSLFRDQGDVGNNGDGKEICDMVVVFGNNIILFSDKDVRFNTNKSIDVAWSRWARKAIKESVRQISGAKRWFREYPDRVYIDSKCSKKLPVTLPKSEDIIFHSILVCHGVEDVLESNISSRSFVIDNSICDDDHWDNRNPKPFHVGNLSRHGFCHIFNGHTIEMVLSEFDTVMDFVNYIGQRESLIGSQKSVKIFSESCLVQLYYENYNEKSGRRTVWTDKMVHSKDINIKKNDIGIFYDSDSMRGKKAMDRVSYFWDSMIDIFTYHILNGTTEYSNFDSPEEIEPSIRVLASTSRFERRNLSESFISFYNKAKPGQRGTRLFIDPGNDKVAFLFFLLPFYRPVFSLDSYRHLRCELLRDYCYINSYLHQDLDYIFGIGCRTRNHNDVLDGNFFDEGQDFVALDASEFTRSDYQECKKLYDEYRSIDMLAKAKQHSTTSHEFPIQVRSGFTGNTSYSDAVCKGRKRNKPCECGSGKKAKKCCF